MTNNKTNQAPGLNPKGLVKMQLMMMAADLVNDLGKYKEALGRKTYEKRRNKQSQTGTVLCDV